MARKKMVLTSDNKLMNEELAVSRKLDCLVGGISVLQEAVVRLLESDPQIAGTTDEELEEAVQNGYDPQIRIQAEAILVAREALRMTGSLNPPNVTDEPRRKGE